MGVEIQSTVQDGRQTLVLSGTLDAAAATPLLKSAAPLLRRGPVTVDLSRVTHPDSAGNLAE